jgi:hypothetical protein
MKFPLSVFSDSASVMAYRSVFARVQVVAAGLVVLRKK